MPQISLYIDEDTLKRISRAAALSNISISEWVSKRIKSSLKNNWPAGYFSLYGAIKDASFKRHHSKKYSDDVSREII